MIPKMEVFISDPVHGSIGISALERQIIGSAPFQRLRNIKQLGNVHLLFPGAVHTRFSHSIGVMYMAFRLWESLIRGRLAESTDAEFHAAAAKIMECVRLAGLLHDVGHGPLSHHFEECLKVRSKSGKDFERIRYRDWDGELMVNPRWIDPAHRDELLDAKLEHEHFSAGVIAHLGAKFGFDAQGVCSLLFDEITASESLTVAMTTIARAYGTRGAFAPSLKRCLKSLLSGEIDADRLDYLQRDSLHCGTRVAAIDTGHLFSSISLAFHDENFYVEIARNAVPVVESVLISRKQMFNQVYYHRLNGSFDMLLGHVVDCLLDEGKVAVPRTLDAFLAMTDATLESQVKAFVRNRALDMTAADLSDRAGLAEISAKFFVTRTPLVRIHEEDVEAARDPERRFKELKESYDSATIVWKMPLKSFYKADRDRGDGTATIKVRPRSADSGPISLADASEVIKSNLWRADTVRLVVYEGFVESARRRGLAETMSTWPIRGSAGVEAVAEDPREGSGM
jgi:HD superfamily phosphohydrolase